MVLFGACHTEEMHIFRENVVRQCITWQSRLMKASPCKDHYSWFLASMLIHLYIASLHPLITDINNSSLKQNPFCPPLYKNLKSPFRNTNDVATNRLARF
eukprot:c37722_g1_i1 orf=147-446(-)